MLAVSRRMGTRASALRSALASYAAGRATTHEPIRITLPRAGATYAFIDGRLVVDGVRQPVRVG